MHMNIIVIEDSDSKLESISSVLKKEIPSCKISVAYSVRSSIDLLSINSPDLIIADMSLPTYDIDRRERGGTPRPFGGVEVFEHLDRFDIEVPVIVITSYPTLGDGENALNLEQLRIRLKSQFPLNYRGAIYFDSAYTNWESEFVELIKKLT